MSTDYSAYLVYGVLYKEDDLPSLNDIASKYSDGMEGKSLLHFGPEGNFYTDYPLLSAVNNSDIAGGSLPGSLVIYVASSMHDLSIGNHYGDFDPTKFPLSLSRLVTPNDDELAQLGAFTSAYPTTSETGWFIVASIS